MLYDEIVVVSGLPRSGTSMMMRMLECGGLPVFIDGRRRADEDNPRGYYELERVKKLPQKDYGWLDSARGKATKIISELLRHLPSHLQYKVIFLERAMPEVLASQKRMLVRRGQNPDGISDDKMSDLFEKHLLRVKDFLAGQDCFDVLYVNYNAVLEKPEPHVESVSRFLGGSLDVSRMREVIEPSLYRQRR